MAGNSVFPPVGVSSPQIATFLAVMLVVVTSILLLNLLISIMSNTYQKIQEKADAEWRRKLCDILNDQVVVRFFYPPKLEPFVTYCKSETDIELECKAEESDVAKRFNKMDRRVGELESKLESKLTEVQAQMETKTSLLESKINMLLDHFKLQSTPL